MATPPVLRIGCAAGFSGDRTDAAGPVVDALIAAGGPAVLIYETLAERTLALAHLAKRQDPAAGYEPLLDADAEPGARTLPARRREDRQQLRRRQPARCGAAHPRDGASSSACPRRASR